MIVDRDSIIQLSDSSVVVKNLSADGGDESREFRYADYSLIRASIRKLVKALVEYYRDELFPDLCGNCGNCCKGRSVRVTAKERQLIQQYLEMEAAGDAHDFLAETATWNERDGVLKKKDGRCVFLRESITGRQFCAIYPVRPYGCFSLSPVMEICEKDTGKLIYHLDTIHIQGDTVLFLRKSKASLERVLDSSSIKAAIEDLRLLCAGVEAPLSAPSEEQVRKEADRKLRQLRYDYIRHGETPMFLERVKEITDYLNGFNREIPPVSAKYSELDEGASSESADADRTLETADAVQSVEVAVSHSEADAADRSPEACAADHSPEAGAAGPGSEAGASDPGSEAGASDPGSEAYAADRSPEAATLFTRISLGPDSAFLHVRSGDSNSELHITYRGHENVIPLVRRFTQMLVQSGDKALLDALWHPDPFCFMCGECCRIYKVEISPYDIERIAEHLQLSMEKMWNSHIHPSIFSWNDADGILAKKDGSRLDVQKSFSPCVFLRDASHDIHYCSIYEFRPEICRSYSADSDKCRILCQLKKWESLIENIVTLEIEGDLITLTTRQTHMQGKPPHTLLLSDCGDLKESFLRLYDALLEIVHKEAEYGGCL
ncbi:MAG: YkgJ family cysteine cluster protein [Candidatus Xenobiia bacterium LiM19]